jgi:hypothetical protein
MIPISVGPNLIKSVQFSAKDSPGDKKTDFSSNPSDNPLDKVNRAAKQRLQTVQRAAEEKRLKEQTAFLNNTFATVNGEAFSGLDLLKVIDAASKNVLFKETGPVWQCCVALRWARLEPF